MRELKKWQIRKIINEAMQLANEVSLRDEINLEDIYKIAEGVKGEKITRREKLVIAGIVRRNYPIQRKVRDKKLKVFIMI